MIIMTEKIKETLLSIKKHYNIDLAIFNDRVKLQKIVYLLKKMDLNALNKYNDFSWYLYGPYSSRLTKDAFEYFPEDSKNIIIDNLSSQIFTDFDKLITNFNLDKNKYPDYAVYELLASIVYFSNQKDLDKIYTKLVEKKPYLSDKELFNKAILILKEKNLINIE